MATPLTTLRVICSCLLLCAHLLAAAGCYTSIFSFGDSLADTGNDKHCGNLPEGVGRLPYGQTYFGHATGRFSDGRLVVDFIAQAMALPLLRPFLAGGTAEDFRHGANFAVAGAAALNRSFFEARGVQPPVGGQYCLDIQIQWFKQLVASSGSSSKDILSNSLVLMGEIGGNDYNYLFSAEWSIKEIQSYVPLVVNRIGSAIIELIELGAKTIVVPGNLALGCAPVYLTYYKCTVEDYEDKTGCIKPLNEFSMYHNNMLVDEISRIRKLHPDVVISYADYYEASIQVFRHPELFGFKSPTMTCCGGDGPYNFSWSALCGDDKSSVCDDPSSSFSWDGIHLTEAAYRTIAHSLLSGLHANPSFAENCPHIQHFFLNSSNYNRIAA